MRLKSLELSGFKSFAKKTSLEFGSSITAIVGPNGSGKSNVAEAFRFVLGEQSMKSMRGKKGEDLIFNGSGSAGRANRASVKLVFDNRNKLFDIDFDEVSLERIVHRDGVNDYLINGSQARLRDIVELLAKANIGSTGHHIISQGEADRILSANPSERREMIEDALGLKIYQYKRLDSERKLEKTEENIKQVQSLRKEIAPHLKFLEKQVEKLEKAASMRDELKELYLEYLKREDSYLSREEEKNRADRKGPEAELARLQKELDKAKAVLSKSSAGDEKRTEVLALENALEAAREAKEKVSRELGRLEGQIIFEKRRLEEAQKKARQEEIVSVQMKKLRDVLGKIETDAREAETAQIVQLREIVRRIVSYVKAFVTEHEAARADVDGSKETLAELEIDENDAKKKFLDAEAHEKKVRGEYGKLKREIEEVADESRAAERHMFEIAGKQAEIRADLQTISGREERLRLERDEFKRELGEAAAMVGREVADYKTANVAVDPAEERSVQEERKKKIEKIKIRLEEYGAGGGAEIMKEYGEVKERDAFFEKEIADLEASAESLRKLIDDLNIKLQAEFSAGIGKINKEFTTYFSLMFGAGAASLSITKEKRKRRSLIESLEEGAFVEEEEETEEGIEINVSLPHKRLRGLHMLSGGERALTSIALIFAMSQVNPPPFLILDETDAALDEANSRRYGDMIENLSKKSQLILITHNRETMGRAGILYGVTMGGEGISKLLSVKFDEAVAVAK